jgi:peptide/nickel transport system permease protein
MRRLSGHASFFSKKIRAIGFSQNEIRPYLRTLTAIVFEKMAKPALYTLGLLLVVALARDLIANERPLWCKVGEEQFFPAVRSAFAWGDGRHYAGTVLESVESQRLWHTLPADATVFPPIPFAPGAELGGTRTLPPDSPSQHFGSRFVHRLGTDDHGRDVAASMVSGARIAILTGAVTMGIALSAGLLLGLVAGYFGDDRLRVRRGRLWLTLLSLPVAWFFAFPARAAALYAAEEGGQVLKTASIFLGIVLVFNLLGTWLSRWPFFSKKINVPADLLIMRLGEVFTATPKLLVIVAVGALAARESQSTLLMLGLIGAMSWPGVARFVRAELLRVRELDFMTAARGLGLSDARIMLRHALPNALRAVLIACALGVASAILLEASLSLLGYGQHTAREVSWGMLLHSANDNRHCWWLVLPPTVAICAIVLALNSIASREEIA